MFSRHQSFSMYHAQQPDHSWQKRFRGCSPGPDHTRPGWTSNFRVQVFLQHNYSCANSPPERTQAIRTFVSKSRKNSPKVSSVRASRNKCSPLFLPVSLLFRSSRRWSVVHERTVLMISAQASTFDELPKVFESFGFIQGVHTLYTWNISLSHLFFFTVPRPWRTEPKISSTNTQYMYVYILYHHSTTHNTHC